MNSVALMLRCAIVIFLLTFQIGAAPAATHATGDVRGVTFFYLDGGSQGFPWVLAHQDDPVVSAKLCAVFQGYSAAGVNWIRLLVAVAHFPSAPSMYEDPTNYIAWVNSFIAKTRSCAGAGPFTIEIVLDPRQWNSGGYFTDNPPYAKDKSWINKWIAGLDMTSVGMILISGDLAPCGWDGVRAFSCYGDSATTVAPLVHNNGHWTKEVFNSIKNQHPSLHVNYEVIAGDTTLGGDLIKKLAKWVATNTPAVSETVVSLYFENPPGSTWQAYANSTMTLLNAYRSATTKPLWIDEFGMRKCNVSDCNTPSNTSDDFSETDQSMFYAGFLGATTCWTSMRSPKIAWVGSRDYPYNNQYHYGLISQFSPQGNYPIWAPAWTTLSQYFNLAACP